MKAEIVSIGTELLLGHIINTNAAYLSRKLSELGIDVYYHTTVGDNPSRLAGAIREALKRADIVIASGGLGPTIDDITAATIARLTDSRLVLNKTILRDLKKYFRSRNIKFPVDNTRQAYVPKNARWIKNKVGTAPGLIKECEGKTIICLPGPPRELEPMFEGAVIPFIKRKHKSSWVIRSRSIKITGLAESQINNKVRDLLNLKPPVTVGIYAKLSEVTLKIMAKERDEKKAAKAIRKIERIICARFKDHIFGFDNETLEGAVGRIFSKKRKTLGVAESCTGGAISNRLTNISGSSRYFLMSAITYSNESKKLLLGVSAESLKRDGAVSKSVAIGMAKGIKSRAHSSVGLGITGIAGPTGGTKAKPVGLVFIAFASGSKKIVREFRFKGSREDIKLQASQAALDLLRRNV